MRHPRTKPKHTDQRARKYLTPAVAQRLIGTSSTVGRPDDCAATLILLMYRHGLRVAEVSRLRWEHIDAHAALLTGRTIHHMVSQTGEAAALPFPVHPHMLRHACGFYLANKHTDTRAIQHYLGHRNIQHTIRYTELAPQRFQDFWDN